jgi:hypothetical protein
MLIVASIYWKYLPFPGLFFGCLANEEYTDHCLQVAIRCKMQGDIISRRNVHIEANVCASIGSSMQCLEWSASDGLRVMAT